MNLTEQQARDFFSKLSLTPAERVVVGWVVEKAYSAPQPDTARNQQEIEEFIDVVRRKLHSDGGIPAIKEARSVRLSDNLRAFLLRNGFACGGDAHMGLAEARAFVEQMRAGATFRR